jgi:15-cis-phytoene synthase
VLPIGERHPLDDLDPDLTLALSYVPARSRAALQALFALDAALGSVVAGGREAMIARIKLAWWREALEALDRKKPPAEPVLQALAEHVLPGGISGTELAAMEEGWALLLSEHPLTPEELMAYAEARGGILFACAARLLGGGEADGRGWALVDLARHCGNEEELDSALRVARQLPRTPRQPSRLRPLGMLASLARRDADEGRPRWERQGSPRRMLRMLRHRFTGF